MAGRAMSYSLWSTRLQLSGAMAAQNGSQQMVKLWGEDALLDWPGALDPVIHDRDAYMAKTILAAAKGKLTPAYHTLHTLSLENMSSGRGENSEQMLQRQVRKHSLLIRCACITTGNCTVRATLRHCISCNSEVG